MSKSRNDIRAAMFSQERKKAASEEITLFGEKVELRQPTLAQVNRLARASANDTKVPHVVRVLIEYCYIPGTDEKVFEEGDANMLAEMPSGSWLNDFNTALEKLAGVNVKEAEKNSEPTA